MKDWMVRALKTFVQAFGGVLVPEIVLLLQHGGIPEDWSTVWTVLAPVICGALAAGISAVWNIILEVLKEKESKEVEE